MMSPMEDDESPLLPVERGSNCSINSSDTNTLSLDDTENCSDIEGDTIINRASVSNTTTAASNSDNHHTNNWCYNNIMVHIKSRLIFTKKYTTTNIKRASRESTACTTNNNNNISNSNTSSTINVNGYTKSNRRVGNTGKKNYGLRIVLAQIVLAIILSVTITIASISQNLQLLDVFNRGMSVSVTSDSSNGSTNNFYYYNSKTYNLVQHQPYAIQIVSSYDQYSPPRTFPRWGNTTNDENNHGIDFVPINDFIMNSSLNAYSKPTEKYHRFYTPTTDHGNDVGKWYPEVLYVIDSNGVHVSDLHRNIVLEKGSATVRDKFVPVELLMKNAFHMLTNQATVSDRNPRWPNLMNAIFPSTIDRKNNSTTLLPSPGFPFLAWYGDYTGCNYMNYKELYSIPLYTVAAHVQCNYTFPFPNYEHVNDAVNTNWVDAIEFANQKYPWSQKVPQIVWRGGITGNMINSTHKAPRWEMVKYIHELEKQYNLNHTNTANTAPTRSAATEILSYLRNRLATKRKPFLFDVGATRIPIKNREYESLVLDEIGSLIKPIPMEDFQLYRGIIDIDGNSWSSRFGRLLCYNSVVLKVEPKHVEYFYYRDNESNNNNVLQPWVHYIPIQADLSDLVQWSEFVADTKNDEYLQGIVHNANEWCRRNVRREQVTIDVLNIWERYVQLLNTNNPNWIQEYWIKSKDTIFDTETIPSFGMSQLSVGTIL